MLQIPFHPNQIWHQLFRITVIGRDVAKAEVLIHCYRYIAGVDLHAGKSFCAGGFDQRRRQPTPKTQAWRLSNTMDVEFCIAPLEEAITKHGLPDIFKTDQGSQFTSPRFTEALRDASVRLSMIGERTLARQCLYRTALALAEIRVRLSPRLRGRIGGPAWHRQVDRILQSAPAPLDPQRADT